MPQTKLAGRGETLNRGVAAWEAERDRAETSARWRFKAENAQSCFAASTHQWKSGEDWIPGD